MSDHNLNVNAKLEIPPSVDNAVSNLTNKPTNSIGAGIADIVDLVFGPVSYRKQKQQIKYAAKLNQFKSELNEKINSIPKENLKEPDFQTAATALDAAKYCLDSEELRSMFANLISGTMDTRHFSQAHPSFAEIIKQMSPLDAQNLALFKNEDYPIAEYRKYEPHEDDCENIHFGKFSILKTNIFLSNQNINDIDLQAASISNLSRLGLLKLTYDFTLENKAYAPFEKTDFFKTIQSANKEIAIVKKGVAKKTPLGKSFIAVCLP